MLPPGRECRRRAGILPPPTTHTQFIQSPSIEDSFDIDTSAPVEDVADVLGVLVAVGQAAVGQRHKLVGSVVGAAGAPGDVGA